MKKVPTSRPAILKRQEQRDANERAVTYDYTWRKFSANYKAANPLCVECLKLGKYNGKDLQVDHITPVEKRPDLMFDTDNLQTLCRRPWPGDYSFMSRKEDCKRKIESRNKKRRGLTRLFHYDAGVNSMLIVLN